LLVHIGDPSSNQATSLESQVIHMIQELFGQTLSGFIIYHVHRNDLGATNRTSNFAWRRFVRIFPTYWAILVISLTVRQFLGNADYTVQLTPSFVAVNALMLPGHDLYINPAWTLRHELLFYSLFLVAVANLRVGLALFATWIALIIASLLSLGITDEVRRTLWNVFSSYLNLYFFAGIVIAEMLRRGRSGDALIASATILVAVVVFSVFVDHPIVTIARQLSICSALVCAGVFLSTQKIPAPRLSAIAGAISYPLYLSHILTMQVSHGLLKRLGESAWLPTILVALVFILAASYVFSRIEKEALSKLGKLLRARRNEPQPEVLALQATQ
jgi:exopolysaccharide production protein ExoZ